MRRPWLGKGNEARQGEEGVHDLLLLELFPPLRHWGSSRLVVAPPTERG